MSKKQKSIKEILFAFLFHECSTCKRLLGNNQLIFEKGTIIKVKLQEYKIEETLSSVIITCLYCSMKHLMEEVGAGIACALCWLQSEVGVGAGGTRLERQRGPRPRRR